VCSQHCGAATEEGYSVLQCVAVCCTVFTVFAIVQGSFDCRQGSCEGIHGSSDSKTSSEHLGDGLIEYKALRTQGSLNGI